MSVTAFQRIRRQQADKEAGANAETAVIEESGTETTGGDGNGADESGAAVEATGTDDNDGGAGQTADEGQNVSDNQPEAVDETAGAAEGMTKKEVMSELKRLGVPFSDRAKVEELRGMLSDALAGE